MSYHEHLDLTQVYATHADVCRALGNINQSVALRTMKQFGYKPIPVAGRMHWYATDVDGAKRKLSALGGIPPPPQSIPIELAIRIREATYGLPE